MTHKNTSQLGISFICLYLCPLAAKYANLGSNTISFDFLQKSWILKYNFSLKETDFHMPGCTWNIQLQKLSLLYWFGKFSNFRSFEKQKKGKGIDSQTFYTAFSTGGSNWFVDFDIKLPSGSCQQVILLVSWFLHREWNSYVKESLFLVFTSWAKLWSLKISFFFFFFITLLKSSDFSGFDYISSHNG